MRLLVLVTDAYGGRGGIARFNRDMLDALCRCPGIDEVIALPRHVDEPAGGLPGRLVFRADAAGSKVRYVASLTKLLARERAFDGVICGHINLLPLAFAAARLCDARLVLVIHGIEAWQRTASRLVNALTRRVDAFVAVSQFTRRRFLHWAGLAPEAGFVIPNCIDPGRFAPGPKRQDLVTRYGLQDRRVLLTVGRMAALERYKGHDEVLDILPELADRIPSLTWLIVGDGDDRPRLEARARSLGMADRVVFAGYVPEHEKADHYRLADVFVMPGRGEGFGIVYLEAAACGIPVVASAVDASREVVENGVSGRVVDPGARADLVAAVGALLTDRAAAASTLDAFLPAAIQRHWSSFAQRCFGPIDAAHDSARHRDAHEHVIRLHTAAGSP